MQKFFDLIDFADSCLKSDTNIDSDTISNIKLQTSKGGYVGVGQIDTMSGNIEYNAKKMAKYIKFGEEIGLKCVVFPAQSLIGCSMETVIRRYPVIKKDCNIWLEWLAKLTNKTIAMVGLIDTDSDGNVHNSVAILHKGSIQKITKDSVSFYNNYAISVGFDKNCINEFLNKKDANIDLLIISAAIQYKHYKKIMQNNTFSNLSSKYNLPLLFVNQVGANDNILYEGISCAYNSSGQQIARAKAFDEQILVINPSANVGKKYNLPNGYEEAVKPQNNFSLNYDNDMERIYKALLLGTKDYFSKCGLKRAVLGLSGGLDSTVCAVLLTDVLGKENVYGVSMPSHITSNESRSDAEQLALNLGINFTEIPIRSMIDTTSETFSQLFNKVEANWNDRYKKSFTPDNIQARSRAMILYGISNEFPSCIPIATSDKSEAYMGYATINGDMSGGFAPIADITKTKLFALARWMNSNRPNKNVIPESVIQKRPGAELAINPKTGKPLIAEDALMPYEFLDEIIWRIENKNESYNDMLNSEFIYEKNNVVTNEQKTAWLDKFFNRMSKAFYKWSIMPPCVMVEAHSINKCCYQQLITSSGINYKGADCTE